MEQHPNGQQVYLPQTQGDQDLLVAMPYENFELLTEARLELAASTFEVLKPGDSQPSGCEHLLLAEQLSEPLPRASETSQTSQNHSVGQTGSQKAMQGDWRQWQFRVR